MSFLRLILMSLIVISGCWESRVDRYGEVTGFQDKVSIAEKFSLEIIEDLTILRITDPWQGADNVSQDYFLVRRGSRIPDDVDSSDVIFVPVQKIICMSTTHVAMIEALGEENTIAGLSGTGFIFSEKINRRIHEGLIKDVGYEASLNNEMILDISPDLIMVYGIGGESAGYIGKIRELGIKILFNADYLETDPLARTEWIKLFGALYCRENLADSIYKTEAKEYMSIKAIVAGKVRHRPDVLLGLPYKDTWYVSPGNSYICRLITDAGGNYLWQNTISAVSMPFGLENVFIRAVEAEFWLNSGEVRTRVEIASIDQRLTELPCYKAGMVYNNNLRMTPNGGNDYWETGSLYPHLILKDITEILHPGILKGHNLLFYKKVI